MRELHPCLQQFPSVWDTRFTPYLILATFRITRAISRTSALCVRQSQYKHQFLGGTKKSDVISKGAIKLIRFLRKPVIEALQKSKRFDAPLPIEEIAEMTKPVLSLGNQYGEGWFLAGEMIELLTHGTPNIVCIQPFACLPNHVVGKGVIKTLKERFPLANIAAVDYDPGASEVNQLNRIKLMLTTAVENLTLTKGEAL